MSITCVAVLCVRNEQAHIHRAIGDFVEQGIDVVVIDHGSSDGTLDICRSFLGKGLLSIEQLPWTGEFDLTAQLQAKRELVARLQHDWVVHADADEWMHTGIEGESLIEGIERISRLGHNAINFQEFVFLPEPGAPDVPGDCKRDMLDYYFFAPRENRLMRAWHRESAFNNISSGGHLLAGDDLRLAQESFVLRHYIVLSQQQAIEKYAGRIFARGDLEKGWHDNRVNLAAERLRLPSQKLLKRLRDWRSVDFDRSDPKPLHFWDWQQTGREAG
jgi:glycosyltransferase involved in cell wall biosynthesis